MTLWVTFVPSFLFVLTGAPYIERLRGSRWIKAALSTVTAAVAGIILNLAAWFAIHVIFPAPGRIDYFALGLSALLFLGSGKDAGRCCRWWLVRPCWDWRPDCCLVLPDSEGHRDFLGIEAVMALAVSGRGC